MNDQFDESFEEDVEIDESEIKEIITVDEAEMLGRKIINYFNSFSDVTDYYIQRKKEKLMDVRETFDGFGQCDSLFCDFDLNPKDFKISIHVVDDRMKSNLWKDLTQITATFPIEDMPGRVLRLLVKEDTTDSIIGMLRIGPPTLNMGPRNKIFDQYLEPNFTNSSCVNGIVIVPVQPLGFNVLGGKLMSLICCSNEVRDILEEKYQMKISLFETTSLYGSIKGCSQYDGLKPFVRYGGDTDSNFPMNLADDLHHEIKGFFDNKDPKYLDITTGSIKLKIYMKFLATIKRVLKNGESEFYDEFLKGMEHSKSLTTKKRYYYCDYGIKNIKDVVLNDAEIEYKKGMSRERFDLENLVAWWKVKAQKRFDNLKKDDRLRTELEFCTPKRLEEQSIDIIR